MRQFADLAAQFADFVVKLHYTNHTCLGIVALQKKLDIHRALEYYIINDLSCLDTLGINASVPLQKRIW